MSKKDLRTEQEIAPHAGLVEVRNAVQKHCKDEDGSLVSRRRAAAMCNLLTDSECDGIISADKDAEKIQRIATRVQRAEEVAAAAKAVKDKKRQSNEPKK